MKRAVQVGTILLAAALPLASGGTFSGDTSSGDTLFGQAVQKLLDKEYPGKDISYLLLETRSTKRLAARWEHPEKPVPVGSLIKPFTAMAYLRAHEPPAPEFTCTGKQGGCWYAPGHGRLNLTGALANSCNAYFLQLAELIEPRQVAGVAREFRLGGLSEQVDGQTMIGMGKKWKFPAPALARAYGQLAAATGADAEVLLNGLALSAMEGTGKAVGHEVSNAPLLVKTGTAPCVHGVEWRSDGYVVVLYPRQSPRFTLMVRLHGKPGAEAAVTAGKMLHTILEAE